MNFEQIRKEIESLLSISLSGQEIENPKVDCKRQWYNFTNEDDKNKFLKDASSIANTVGLDGFIIIGYDEKDKKFYDATFSDSGLRDTSDLNGVINRNVDRFFEISNHEILYNGHKLSILHIPPSFDKPHVITCYKTFKSSNQVKEEKHRIFVRKGTSSDYATKYDLEFMYYDRKNVMPEYSIISSVNLDKLLFRHIKYGSDVQFIMDPILTFENSGRRPVAIVLIDFQFLFEPKYEKFNYCFTSGIISPIILHPNEIINNKIRFETGHIENLIFDEIQNLYNLNRELRTTNITLRMSNNKIIKSELIRYI
jgi:Putative DNA-binding domain